jgi:transcriptional regulator with XRE-family HTH domain
MTTTLSQVAEMPLLEEVRAAHLPPPARRRAIRDSAKLSREDIARELRSQGFQATATAVFWWERDKALGGCTPRRAKAAAYRQLLDRIQQEVASWSASESELAS